MVDASLSPLVARWLREAGHQAVHVQDYSLGTASDETILERAAAEGQVILAGDTDFGELLARRALRAPSFVLFRGRLLHSPTELTLVLLQSLNSIEGELEAGAIAVFDRDRVRIRRLPVDPPP